MKRRNHHSTKALQPQHWAEIGLVNQNPASATTAAQEAAFFFFKTLAIKKQAITLILKKTKKR